MSHVPNQVEQELVDAIMNVGVEEVSPENQEQPQEQPQIQQEQIPQDKYAYNNDSNNIARMRDRMERAEQERDEINRRYRAELEAKNGAVGIGIGDDDLVEGKHLSKVSKDLQGVRNELQETRALLLETRIRNNFPDYEAIVTQDTIAQLQREHPEVAQAIASCPDKYAQAASAYKMIKNLGVIDDPFIKASKARATANLAKPRPLTSLNPQEGESPLHKANEFAEGLTPELKNKLWQEMNRATEGR